MSRPDADAALQFNDSHADWSWSKDADFIPRDVSYDGRSRYFRDQKWGATGDTPPPASQGGIRREVHFRVNIDLLKCLGLCFKVAKKADEDKIYYNYIVSYDSRFTKTPIKR